jgi:predicted phosphodiesterase
MTIQLALLSDVHANLHALDAVLASIASRSALAGTYHLGDLVGYHAFPNEVTARLRSAGIAGVAGNYDSTVAMHYKHCGCRSENPRQEELAHQSFTWTLAAVSEETRETLAALPFRLDIRPLGGHVAGPTVILLHATPTSNLVYVTEDRSDDFLRKMAQQAGASAGDVIAFGHTHKPWHRMVDDVLFVNTGSVGRPKDGDARAGWTLLTLGDGAPRAEQVRVDYDIEGACAAVAAAGLPEEFAQSLRTGRA